MKKLIFLLLIFISSVFTFAQNTFAPVGAEWWYAGKITDYYIWAQPDRRWVDHLESVLDTVVLDIPCRKLVATRHERSGFTPDVTTITTEDSFFVYNNDDTVFVFDRSLGNFTPLYIFNVDEGDTVCMRVPSSNLPAMYYQGTTFCYIVDSIRMENYGNTQLKSYYTRTLMDNTGTQSVNWGTHHINSNIGRYTQVIGANWSATSGLFPSISSPMVPDGSINTLAPTGRFRCYTDSAHFIKLVGFPCDEVAEPFVSIESVVLSPSGIQVYPNPSKDVITIRSKIPFAKDASIHIMDASGRSVKTISGIENKENIQVNLEALVPGMYLMQVHSTEGNYYHKLVLTK